MATKNYLDYSGLSRYDALLKQYIGESQSQIFIDTTANWEKQTTLVSIRGAIYIYSDHQTENNTDIPGIKVGDGLAYVVDLPFVGKLYDEHIADTISHITAEERAKWNSKVTCFIDNQDTENLVFSTDATIPTISSEEVRSTLLACLNNVAWATSDGQQYYDDLEDALTPDASLTSIDAVFTQGSAIVYTDDTLDSLKQYLVVTANYDDGTSEVVTTYTLSGTLTAGTSTITAIYQGKTDTFTVTVTAPKEISSIDVVFTQGSAVIYEDTSLDSLKQYLTVTVTYTDTSTEVVTSYTLSGTLVVGTSTITVSYHNFTDTFDVTVSQHQSNLLYNWDFTESLTDTIQSRTATLYSDTSGNEPHREDGVGVVIDKTMGSIRFGNGLSPKGKTFEYDVVSANFQGDTSHHMRQLCFGETIDGSGLSPFMWRATSGDQGWSIYGYINETGTSSSSKGWGTVWGDLSGSSQSVLDCCSGKTVKIVISKDGWSTSVYLDDVLLGTQTGIYWRDTTDQDYMTFGGRGKYTSEGDQCQVMTISGLRVYETVEVESIDADFNQGSTVIYDTDTLESLKQYLTVTADYDDGTSNVITDYNLSGTLSVGTSTITVSYGGKTDTFTVTVTEKVVSSISAVFNQGSDVIYNDANLDSLRQYLTVTATYDDTTTAVITDYSLSGTLVVGTSTITVTYRNQTDTFNVTVTERQIEYLYNWDFTQSLTDSVRGRAAVLRGSDSSCYPVQDENGLHFTQPTAAIYLSNGGMINFKGKTFEFDIAYANFTGNTSKHIRYLMASAGTSYGTGPLIWKAGVGWSIYGYTKSTGDTKAWGDVWGNLSGSSSEVLNCMSGKTVKIVCSTNGLTTSLYIDNELIGTQNKVIWRGGGFDGDIYFGGFGSSANSGDQVQELTLTGLRIYNTIE